MVACTSNVDEIDPIATDPDYIVLSAKALGVTRSADTDVESTLAKIDVYVMDANFNVIHSERITPASPVSGQGQFVMKKKRNDFTEGAGYYVYMIANSTSATLPQANTWDDLLELTQEDKNIHLTGMSHVQDVDAPDYFLMDGFAYLSSEATTSAPKTMSPIIINDGDRTKKVELSGTLYRAAAKFILNISQGESVEFKQVLDNATPAYMLYQLPISTLVVTPEADARYTSTKQNTKEWGPDTNFVWTTDKNGKPQITFIGYGYANDWSKELSINETALLISIPMMWDKNGISTDGKEASSPVNWYKIPLSEQSKFERNTCYVINVNINAIGAEEQNVPVELKDIEYVTLPWQDVKLNIGDYDARYLTLNTDLVKIYDKNFDLNQLTFTSSSPIVSIKLKDVFSHNERMGDVYGAFTALEVTKESADGSTEAEYETGDGVYAYYIDKFGQKIQLGTDPNFDLKDIDHPGWSKEDILAREKNLYNKDGVATADQYIRAEVPAEQKRALNGNIHIYSPIYADATNDDLNWNSHFNTVRYLEFEVRNEQGLTATFRVEQRPTIIITNEEGYFSYRSDQKYSVDQEEVSHYHNYMGWQSIHLSGLMFLHVHEWSKEFEMTDEWWNSNRNERDYSWVVPQACPANKQNSGWDIVHYGNIGNSVSWRDSNGVLQNKVYGGLYRPSKEAEAFVRWRYNGIGASNNDSQGLAMGELFEKDGKWYRNHYIWNVNPIFYNLYVSKVWEEEGIDGQGKNKQRGQADINSMTHAKTTYYQGAPASGWASWGLQTRYNNHRMYHIVTSNTSDEYTVAYPTLQENGMPNNVPYNSKVISPGLVIASQLGETRYQEIVTEAKKNGYFVPSVGEFYELARDHCKEYVETTFVDKPDANGVYNGVWDEGEEVIHYDDWRLPTKAEIDRIIEFQNSSRAMDRLLTGQYYFCITGNGDGADIKDQTNWVSNEVLNHDNTMTGYYIRCVRDAGRKIK